MWVGGGGFFGGKDFASDKKEGKERASESVKTQLSKKHVCDMDRGWVKEEPSCLVSFAVFWKLLPQRRKRKKKKEIEKRMNVLQRAQSLGGGER